MTYGLDTSVVLRLITGDPSELSARVITRIADLLRDGNDFFMSDLVISETYYALQHFYGMEKEDAVYSIRGASDAQGFSISPEARAALDTPDAWHANPGMVDRMIANEYAARGHVTLSCEKSFRRLDLTEVIK